MVCGINNKKIQRLLLPERELTLKKAEKIALGEELAARHVVDIQSDTTPAALIRDSINIIDCPFGFHQHQEFVLQAFCTGAFTSALKERIDMAVAKGTTGRLCEI